MTDPGAAEKGAYTCGYAPKTRAKFGTWVALPDNHVASYVYAMEQRLPPGLPKAYRQNKAGLSCTTAA